MKPNSCLEECKKYEIKREAIMDWIERNNCDVCAVNETGLTKKYMAVSDGWKCVHVL